MKHPDDVTLNLYLDDALAEPARAQVEAHLAACEVCQRELDAMREVFSAFQAWDVEPIPRDLTPHVLTRIARRPSPAAVSRWGTILLGAQLGAAVLILMWVLPLVLPGVMGTVRSYLPAALFPFQFDVLGDAVARIATLAPPFPSVALWVWVVALVVLAVIWVLGNRLILNSVERTEASQ